jgi:hypothetical protein
MSFQAEDRKRAGRGNACLETIGKDDKEKVLSHVIIRDKMALQNPIFGYIKSKQYCTGTYKKWYQHMVQPNNLVAIP